MYVRTTSVKQPPTLYQNITWCGQGTRFCHGLRWFGTEIRAQQILEHIAWIIAVFTNQPTEQCELACDALRRDPESIQWIVTSCCKKANRCMFHTEQWITKKSLTDKWNALTDTQKSLPESDIGLANQQNPNSCPPGNHLTSRWIFRDNVSISSSYGLLVFLVINTMSFPLTCAEWLSRSFWLAL